MESSPYTPPNSDLTTDEMTLETKFGTLNIWRKIYIIFVWLASLLSVGVLMLVLADSDQFGFGISITLSVILLGAAYWTHWAIVKRRIGHITAIAILNFVPGGNIIGCLIMISIRRVSVKERENYKL